MEDVGGAGNTMRSGTLGGPGGSLPTEETFLSNPDGRLSLDTFVLSFDNVIVRCIPAYPLWLLPVNNT